VPVDVVEVDGLRRSYGAFEALKGVSFRIRAGQIVGLLGPNGAGKSTTMKILTGWLAPTGGTARVCGVDVLDDPLEARRHLGYLPESAPVYGEMKVRAYLEFVARVRGLGDAERARGIERVAHECGLEARMDQRIGTLSKGFRQRVGLAQALVHEPRLLILDEPTNGLDPNQIREIRDLVRSIGRTRTVVLSTHILREVEATCDRVLLIHQGTLVADEATTAVVAAGGAGHRVTVGLGRSKVKTVDAELHASLSLVAGVRHVDRAAPLDEAHRFVVHADGDVREAIFRWAVDAGHVIVELSSVRSDLEDVFARLTHEGAA
jgi:ABC-2 type transport system ATP-binding protein